MNKRDEIIRLIKEIDETKDRKKEAVMSQNYAVAAGLRDEERVLTEKLDEVSGVKDFHYKVYNTEIVLQHINTIINSTEELKKLRPNFKEVYGDLNLNKYLLTLYKQRDEAYQAMLQIKSNIK